MNVKFKVIVAVAACASGLLADPTTSLWDLTKTAGDFNDPENWSAGVPGGGAVNTATGADGIYGDVPAGSDDITITFPSGGFIDDSITHVYEAAQGESRTVTFDASGTYWEKNAKGKNASVQYPSADTHAFKFLSRSGVELFRDGSTSLQSKPFTLTDGVVRFVSSNGQNSVSLDRGVWTWSGGKLAPILRVPFHVMPESSFNSSLYIGDGKSSFTIHGGNHKLQYLWLGQEATPSDNIDHPAEFIVKGNANVTASNVYVADKARSQIGGSLVNVSVSDNASFECAKMVLGGGNSHSPGSGYNHVSHYTAGNTGRLYLRDNATAKMTQSLRLASRPGTTGIVEVADNARLVIQENLKIGTEKDSATGLDIDTDLVVCNTSPDGIYASVTVSGNGILETPRIAGWGESDLAFNGGKWIVPSGRSEAFVRDLSHFTVGTDGMEIEANSMLMIDQEINASGVIRISGGADVVLSRNVNGAIKLARGSVLSVADASNVSVESLSTQSASGSGIRIPKNSSITIGSTDGIQGVVTVEVDPESVAVGDEWTAVRSSSGNIDASKFVILNSATGKIFSLVSESESLKVKVAASSGGDTLSWNGSGSFGNAANWDKNVVPGIEDTVVINVADGETVINIDDNAQIRKLEKTGAGRLVFSGNASLSLNEIDVTGGEVKFNVPAFLSGAFSCAIPEGTKVTFAGTLRTNFSKTEFTKTGLGELVVSGDNADLIIDWIIPGGINTFVGPNSFGADTASGNGLVLANNTLRYEGAPAIIKRPIKFTGPMPTCFDIAGSLTFKEFVTTATGTAKAYVKTGVGDLTFELTTYADFFKDPDTRIVRNGTFAIDANGLVTSWNGLCSLNVLEGTLRIRGLGKEVTSGNHFAYSILVGGSGYKADAEPELIFDSVNVNTMGYDIIMGSRVVSETKNPKLTLTNSVVNCGYVYFPAGVRPQGHTIDEAAYLALRPQALLSDSILNVSEFFVCRPGKVTLESGSKLVKEGVGFRTNGNYDMSDANFIVTGGSSIEMPASVWQPNNRPYQDVTYDPNTHGGISVVGEGTTLKVGRLEVINLNGSMKNTPDLEYPFDGGTLHLTMSDVWSAIMQPECSKVVIGKNGMHLKFDGTIHTTAMRFTGEGQLIKEGSGTCVFDMAASFNGSGKPLNPATLPGIQNDGGIKVAEGAAVIGQGAMIREDLPIEVCDGGALSLGGQSLAFASVAGSGIISNGTITVSKIYRNEDQIGSLTFKDVAINDDMIEVDFGLGDGENLTSMDQFVVATLDNAASHAVWKSVNTGDKYKMNFTQKNGMIVGKPVSRLGMTIIIR